MPASIILTTIIAALFLSPLTLGAPSQTNIERDATPANRPATAPSARATPNVMPIAGTYLPMSEIMLWYGATNGSSADSPFARAYHSQKNSKRSGKEGTIDDIANELTERWSPALRSTKAAATCVGSTNDTVISALFYYGGAGTTVNLCPSALILTTNAIFYTAANQVLTTLGNPTDKTRATIRVTAPLQSCAIYGACGTCNNIQLRNVQVDGNRPVLGYMQTGLALIEMGGPTSGQLVTQVRAFEPTGWSCLHFAEGSLNCAKASIINNQIGPSGNSPTNPLVQFKRGNRAISYPGGQWADGISVACTNSIVSGNVVTDATDGGIVLFQAPGTTVTRNTIISSTRQLLGGINAVDYAPFGGGYTGVTVTNNHIISNTAFIKIGIAIGTMSWSSYNTTLYRNFNGAFTNNVLSSGSSGYFGTGISVAGMNGTTVTGNSFSGANFGGAYTQACLYPNPLGAPLVADPYTVAHSTVQNNFQLATFGFGICIGPSNIITKGLTLGAPSATMAL